MKKISKRIVVFVSVLALSISMLAGCGKKDEGSSSGTSSSGNKVSSAEAKQNVFSMQEVSDLFEQDSEMNITSVGSNQDGYYFLVTEYDYSGDVTQTYLKLYSVDLNGNKKEPISLERIIVEAPEAVSTGNAEDGAVNESEDTPVDESAIMPLAEAETQEKLESAAEEDIMLIDSYGDYEEYVYSYDSYEGMNVISDRVVGTFTNEYYSNAVSQTKRYICAWSLADGSLLWSFSMDEFVPEDTWCYVNFSAVDQSGKTCVAMTADSPFMIFLDENGNLLEKKSLQDSPYLEWTNGCYTDANNNTYLFYYISSQEGENYISKLKAVKIDFESKSFGEEYSLPDTLSNNGFNCITKGASSDFVVATSDGLYTLNMGDTDITKFMDYVNSDLLSYGLNQVAMIDKEHFVASFYTLDDYQLSAGLFSYVDPSTITDKEVITLGTCYLSGDVRKRVVDFNKTSDKYRIVVKNYETYNTQEDYSAGFSKLDSDVLSGNMPDILFVEAYSNMDVDAYAKKGLLADIDKLIEADADFSADDFLSNVFDAYRMNGKLYMVVPSFEVVTYYGKQSVFADKVGWTPSQFLEFSKTLSPDQSMFRDMTRDNFLSEVMRYNGSSYVDVATGKCDFNNEEFISLLKYAATLPETIEYDDSYWSEYDAMLSSNKAFLNSNYIYDAFYAKYYTAVFGEAAVPVGFPSSDGKGTILSGSSMYAISAKSKNTEGAWAFVKYYLSDEYQNSITYEIPVKKTAFETWLNNGKNQRYWEDGDGNKEYYNETYYLNGIEIEVAPLSDAEAEELRTLVTGCSTKRYYNEAVQSIISEEASALFSGQKSAEDVAQIIQSRVQIYVSENS